MRKRELVVEQWLNHLKDDRNLEATRASLAATGSKDADAFEAEVILANNWEACGMQVYEFDRDFTDSILDEKWIDLLPDCICRRPHDSFYMKLSGTPLMEGCVVDIADEKDVINRDKFDYEYTRVGKGVYLCNESHSTIVNTGRGLVMVNYFAIPKAFDYMFDDTDLGFFEPDIVANAVAYLCSKNADIVASYSPNKGLKRNNAKRRSAATWHEVGYRVGADLRAYKRYQSDRREHQGGTVRPHMRRAHWHHYWTGPRDGERNLVLKWLAPTMVGVSNGSIESATIHMA